MIRRRGKAWAAAPWEKGGSNGTPRRIRNRSHSELRPRRGGENRLRGLNRKGQRNKIQETQVSQGEKGPASAIVGGRGGHKRVDYSQEQLETKRKKKGTHENINRMIGTGGLIGIHT